MALKPERAMCRIRLRPARPEDVAGIAACVDAAYAPYVERLGRPPGPMLDDHAAVVAASRVQVATRGGARGETLVGAVVLEAVDGGSHIRNVAVIPAVKGQGVGRRLLEWAEAEARRRGHTSIHLATHQRMTENRALYARIGYAEQAHRRVDGYPRVLLRKPLA